MQRLVAPVSSSLARISVPALVAAEIATAGTLTVILLNRAGSWSRPVIAIGAAAIVALVVLAVAAVALVSALALPERDRLRAQHRDRWADTWIGVVFGDAPEPDGPLNDVAIDTLLDLRESLIGEPAERVAELVHSYGIDTTIATKIALQPKRRPHLRLLTNDAAERAEILDDAGRARSPEVIPALLEHVRDAAPSEHGLGIRALARSVAAITNDADRRAVVPDVLRVLQESDLTQPALSEAIQLFGAATDHVVTMILSDPRRWGEGLIVAALEAAGLSQTTDHSRELTKFASAHRVAVRIAALHSLSKLQRLPAAAGAAVEKAFNDRNPAVRIEAAQLAKLLEPRTAITHLEELLCDREWSVRRAAATTLASLGGPGIRTLIATSLVHGDPRARSVATQTLVESRSESELHAEPETVG